MDISQLSVYWNAIPIGENNAIEYFELMTMWNKKEREVRRILHELSYYDNGDNYILIRSGKGKGFYRSDDIDTMKQYRHECLRKGRSIFAPVKKINRVLSENDIQFTFDNNLRVMRENKGLKQLQVCKILKRYDKSMDCSMLSKMENGICLPTPFMLAKIAEIYDCETSKLINIDLYQ